MFNAKSPPVEGPALYCQHLHWAVAKVYCSSTLSNIKTWKKYWSYSIFFGRSTIKFLGLEFHQNFQGHGAVYREGHFHLPSGHSLLQASWSLSEHLVHCCCCCCCCWVASVVSDSVWPQRRQPTRLLCPWGSPGKNIGVGISFTTD